MTAWSQLNVVLAPETAAITARAVFAALGPRLAESRARGSLACFFFMRKAPGMRLRFAFDRAPEAELAGCCAALADGVEARVFSSVYEPEARLFGGEEAMRAVHAYFDADAALWMELDRLSERREATLPHDVLAGALMNDLFVRALDGPTEVWDAWWNVCAAQGAFGPAEPLAVPALSDLADLADGTGTVERTAIERYDAANARLAGELRRLWSLGRLGCGLRGALPFVALFHFNRYGLDARVRDELARAIAASWDPRRQMKGATS